MFENIYIHVPFCHSKCDYCVFFSEVDSIYRQDYLDKIGRDIYNSSQKYGKKFKTLYIGGGTPTILSTKELENFFANLSSSFDLSNFNEISIECNPETLTAEKVKIIRDFVTRISLGVQSFDSDLRDVLGRKCSNQAIYNAIELINSANFHSFNIDLIYAIVGQSVKDFELDLACVAKANATHLSAYNLTIEEQSKLAKREIALDEDLALEMYKVVTNNQRFKQYEISNYAISEEFNCQHNTNIWKGQTLLGLGPAASSFDGKNRYTQSYSIPEWLNSENTDYDIISKEERCNEIFAINLRTIKGWNRAEFELIFPNKFDEFLAKSLELQAENPTLFNIDNNHISLTSEGLLFWDDVFMEFL